MSYIVRIKSFPIFIPLFLLIFLISSVYSQDFNYNEINQIFPGKTLSFKENQKYYKRFKSSLEKLTYNNPTEENWFMLAQFIIDYSEEFDNDMEDASEIINEALDILLDGVTIKDIQNDPSSYSKHMYLMKRFIKFLEHTIYEESGKISLFNTFSKSEKTGIFIDKIGLINNFNHILTTDEQNITLKEYVSRNLHTPILELRKTKEHPGVNVFLNNPGSLEANIIQYVFFENEESIDKKFQIYLYKSRAELKTFDEIYNHIIDVEISEEKYPFFFDDGKNIIRDKINLYHKYLELGFNTDEFALNFFDILIKPVIEYDKKFLNIDQSFLNKIKGIEESTYGGPHNVFILDNAIAKIPLESLKMTQDYLIDSILPFDLNDYGIERDSSVENSYIDNIYVIEYANSLNELLNNINYLQSRIEELPGYDDFVDYLLKSSAIDEDKLSEAQKKGIELSIAQYLQSINIVDHINSKEMNINIFSMSNFESYKNKEAYYLKKFNISGINDLKFVNNEVDAIHKTIQKWKDEYDVNVNSYNRKNSETFFKNYNFNKEDIIHIATHGFPLENEVSALALNPDNYNDGFLTYREVQKLDIDARLVVLSACNTKQGESYNNIHSLSIARAFKDIGVQNVIGTLWPIDDEATAKFMEIFYDTLINLENRNIVYALKYTKLQMRQLYPNPHYWAGFVLYGNY